jgi:hypothetical protein
MEAEDAFIWHSPRYGNRYYAVARDVVGTFTGVSGGLAQFQSDDGLHWTASAQPKVLGTSFTWTSGTVHTTRVERPFVLLENDLPVALYGATDGYDPGGRLSFNVHIPLLDPPSVLITRPSADAITLADTQTRLTLTAEVDSALGVPAVSWAQASGPAPANIADATAATTSVGFPADGVYVLTCSVTDTAGTATDQITVAVNAPLTIALRQGVNGYSHTAAMIRGDNPTWNGGARDQFLIGRWTGKGMRAVFSFPLSGISADSIVHATSLDLWTAGVSSTVPVKALQLKQLAATPIEGTGNGQNSTAATSGVTWNHRTAQPDPAIAWTTAGGDMASILTDELAGYTDTTANLALSFPSSSAFIAAAQTAVSSGAPLDLALVSPLTESATTDALTRIAADDHATASLRPRLNITFSGNLSPVINPGTAPAAIRMVPAALMATVSHADSVAWKLLSGPGTAVFSNANSAATSATFSHTGVYQIELGASNALGESTRPLEVTVAPNPAFFVDWQSITWPNITDPQSIGPNMDPDRDGLTNLLEWALRLDPTACSNFQPVFAKVGATLSYTYSRRKTAPDGATFQVEWSDRLGSDWSTAGVGQEIPVSSTADTRTVTVSIPSGPANHRFVRVRVTQP